MMKTLRLALSRGCTRPSTQHRQLRAAKPRSTLLAEYQQRQAAYRRWRGRVGKRSGADTAASLADKDIRIAELEATVQLLTASHLAMLRAVGELGGFSKWARFYEQYRDARDKLAKLGAIPEAAVSPMPEDSPKRRDDRRRR